MKVEYNFFTSFCSKKKIFLIANILIFFFSSFAILSSQQNLQEDMSECFPTSKYPKREILNSVVTIQRNIRACIVKKNPTLEEVEKVYQHGLRFRNGEIEGFPKKSEENIKNAEFYFRLAANLGHPKAQHNLAMILFDGYQFEEAYSWFFRASRMGLEQSKRNLKRLLDQGYFNSFTLEWQSRLGEFDNLSFTEEETMNLKEKFLEKFFKNSLLSIKGEVEKWPPSCFFSYAWGNSTDTAFVRRLAKDVTKSGIKAVIDIWGNTGGTFISSFTENIGKCNYVILFGTKNLMNKYQDEQSGSVINMEISQIFEVLRVRPGSVIPILFEGSKETSLPGFLHDVVYVDFSLPKDYYLKSFNLLKCLLPDYKRKIDYANLEFNEQLTHMESEDFNRREVKMHLLKRKCLLIRKQKANTKSSEEAAGRVLTELSKKVQATDQVESQKKQIPIQLKSLGDTFKEGSSQMLDKSREMLDLMEKYQTKYQLLKRELESYQSKMEIVNQLFSTGIGWLLSPINGLEFKESFRSATCELVKQHNQLVAELKKRQDISAEEVQKMRQEIASIQLRYLRCIGFELDEVSPLIIEADQPAMYSKGIIESVKSLEDKLQKGLSNVTQIYDKFEGIKEMKDYNNILPKLGDIFRMLTDDSKLGIKMVSLFSAIGEAKQKRLLESIIKPLLVHLTKGVTIYMEKLTEKITNPSNALSSEKEAAPHFSKAFRYFLVAIIDFLEIDVNDIKNLDQIFERIEAKIKSQ